MWWLYNDVNTSCRAAIVHRASQDSRHPRLWDIMVATGESLLRSIMRFGGHIAIGLMNTGWAKRLGVGTGFQKQGKVPRLVRIFFRWLVEKNVRLQVKQLAMLSMLRGQ